MSSVGSVTQWIRDYQDGSDQAVSRLWEFYFERMVDLARRKLGVTPRMVYDEEDVALSAFKSACKGMQMGRTSDDLDRDDLWKLMTTITLRKVYDCIKFNQRKKRKPHGKQIVNLENQAAFNEIISREPDPKISAQVEEQFRLLVDSLVHEDLKQIAILKIDGHTNPEIAKLTGRGLSTIERKLRTIREIWRQESEI